MDLLAELARLDADPTLVVGVQDMVQRLQQQIVQQPQQIQSLEFKNQKLVLELAHLKHLRFCTQSETLTAEQRMLFEDDADQDLAVVQAELTATMSAAERKPRLRAGRQPLSEHLERIANIWIIYHCIASSRSRRGSRCLSHAAR